MGKTPSQFLQNILKNSARTIVPSIYLKQKPARRLTGWQFEKLLVGDTNLLLRSQLSQPQTYIASPDCKSGIFKTPRRYRVCRFQLHLICSIILASKAGWPVPQKVHFLVWSRGWAGAPPQRRVIENGARSQLNDTSGTAGIIMSRL